MNPWLLLAAFGAGVGATLLGSLITGLLVIKTKYAGERVFTKEPKHGGEAFNVDEDFIEDEIEPTEHPEVIEEANRAFVDQFNADQMIRDLQEKERIEKEAEDLADQHEVLDNAT